METYRVIGKSLPRVDAPLKVTGQAKYTMDMKLPRMLYGRLLTSPLPHARVLRVDASRALRLPGVKAVITGADTPYRWGVHPQCYDQQPLATDKVRYVGDAVAAVAAVDEDAAAEALELIEVDYEELPAVFDPEGAMAEGAPLVHEDRPGNIALTKTIRVGDPEEAWRRADAVFEDTFVTQRQAHVCFERHVCIAEWAPGGKLTLYYSTQAPALSSQYFSKFLHMRESDIRIITNFIGGGFGAKATSKFNIDFCSIVLARKTGRPVKMAYTREEEFISSSFRSNMKMRVKTGVTRDMKITGRSMEMLVENGAYSDYGPILINTTASVGGTLYRMPVYHHHGKVVYTNNPPGGAMRGIGSVCITFAYDSQMDIIAREMGWDPAEFRLANAVQVGDTTASGAKLRSCALSETIRECVRRVEWKAGRRASAPHRRRGVGLASAVHFTGVRFGGNADIGGCFLKMNIDGSVHISSGTIDMGNGSNTALSQICAEALGARPEDVAFYNGDTGYNPIGWGIRGSRTTTIDGMAVHNAAREARAKLFEAAAELLECSPEDLDARDGTIFLKAAPSRSVAFREAVQRHYYKTGSEAIYITHHYDAPSQEVDPKTGLGDYSSAYSFGSKVAEVEVDTETGEVEVLRVVCANDVGRVINPLGAMGQLEGGVLMGVGFALMEELQVEGGQPTNASFVDYKLPSTKDTPKLEVALIESPDPVGPFGAKGLGEMAQVGTTTAIANAIQDAVGVRIRELPITPEKILDALRGE